MNIIDDLFTIKWGQKALHSKGWLQNGNQLIISSKAVDNGCYGFFDYNDLIQPPFITVQSTGSIGEAIVQEYPCGVVDDCLLLFPKKPMEIEKLYFVATVIRQDKWRYNYGRKITPIRLKSLEIDFSKMDEKLIKKIRRNLLNKVNKFKKDFEINCVPPTKQRADKVKVSDLFDISYGQHELNSKDYLKQGDTMIISSTGADNGCYGFFECEAKYNTPIITVPRTGSIGMAFVQEYPCSVDDNCLVLTLKNDVNINVEEMYFIASIIRLESWRYRYGRQITETRLGKLEIDFSKFNYAMTNAMKDKVHQLIDS